MFGPPLYCPDYRHASWCMPKVQWLQCGAGPRLGRRQQCSGRYLSDGGLGPVSSLLQDAHTVVTGCQLSSIIFDKLLFDGDCWTVWTPCTVLRAGAGQHSKLQTGPSPGIRTPSGPGRGRHRHANCGLDTGASDINNFTRQSTFFCILTFFGWIVGKIHLSRSLIQQTVQLFQWYFPQISAALEWWWNPWSRSSESHSDMKYILSTGANTPNLMQWAKRPDIKSVEIRESLSSLFHLPWS